MIWRIIKIGDGSHHLQGIRYIAKDGIASGAIKNMANYQHIWYAVIATKRVQEQACIMMQQQVFICAWSVKEKLVKR